MKKGKKVLATLLTAGMVSTCFAGNVLAQSNGYYANGTEYLMTDVAANPNLLQVINDAIGKYPTTFAVDLGGKRALYKDYIASLGTTMPSNDSFNTYAGQKPFNVPVGSTVYNVANPSSPIINTDAPTSSALAVSSVSAINSTQIQVVFNQAVDSKTAQQTANYVIAGGTTLLADPTGAVLQSDGKTVILNVAPTGAAPNKAALINLQQYNITIQNVLDKNNNKMATTTQPFTVSDATIPQITTAVAKGNRVIQLTFSKSVQNVNANDGTNFVNFKLDNNVVPIASTTVVPSLDGTSATITFNTGLTAGNHTLAVLQDATAPIKDFVGYKVAPVTFTPTVAPDTSVAQVTSVVATSQTSATVTFNKPMNVNLTGDLANFFWNASGSVTDASNAPDKITTTDNQTFTLTFNTKPMTVGNLNFFVQNEVDYSGNVMIGNVVGSPNASQNTVSVTASAPTTVSTASASDTSTVKVTFSGALDTVTSQLANNYTITDSTNKTVVLSQSTLPSYNAALQQVTLKTNAPMTSGTYTLAISGVKDVLGNTIATTSKTFTVTDTTAPAASPTTINFDAAGKNVVINFTKAMAVTGANSVLNTANYVYTPNGGTATTLPAGTVITAFNNNKGIRITAPVATFAAGDTIVIGSLSGTTLNTVADANGNLLGISPALTLAAAAVTADDLSVNTAGYALTVKDSQTAKLTLATSQNALYSVVAGDFNISLDNGATWFAPANAQLDSSDTNNKTILFTLPSGQTLNSGSTIQVKTLGTTASTDIYAQKLAINKTASSTANNIAAQLVSGAVTAPTSISLTFAGDVSTAAGFGTLGNAQGSIIITQGTTTISGTGITNAVATKVGNNTTVVLTLGTAVDPSQSVIVKTVSADFMLIKDANGNNLVANTTGTDVSVFANSSVSTVRASNIYKSGDTFVVGFNRIVDPTTIVANWNGTGTQPVTVQFNANGTAVIAGANVGTFSGLQVTGQGTATGTIGFDAAVKTLTVTLTSNPTGVVTVNNGALTYTPASVIKSASGVAVNSTFVSRVALTDAKPQVQTVVFSNGGTASTLDAGDKITFTFSKPVDPSTIATGLTSSTPVSNLALNTAIADLGSFATPLALGTTGQSQGTNSSISIDSTGTVVTLTVGNTFAIGTGGTPTAPAGVLTPTAGIKDTTAAGATAIDGTITPTATGTF